jgi:flagellar hook-associated protein 3 FlgL
MISSVNPAAEQFLADVSRVQSQIDQANRQISSGSKISQPSDDPGALEGLMRLRADIARNAQVSTNLAEVKSETDTAEQSLETATQLMDRVTSLASQGANTTETADQRASIATEVTGILNQLVGLSQTTVQGRYVFSGDQDQSPQYQIDLSNANGVDRLSTATATRQVQDASGVGFTTGLTAQDIFDHRNPDDSLASDNVFAAVNSLRVALTNNDQAGIATALTSLHTASDYLGTQLAFYGSVQSRISDATDFASKQQTQLQIDLGSVQDADVTQAALQLTQSTTQLQTALSAEAKIPHSSLFDFLA